MKDEQIYKHATSTNTHFQKTISGNQVHTHSQSQIALTFTFGSATTYDCTFYSPRMHYESNSRLT